jgi:hypothetical protein
MVCPPKISSKKKVAKKYAPIESTIPKQKVIITQAL